MRDAENERMREGVRSQNLGARSQSSAPAGRTLRTFYLLLFTFYAAHSAAQDYERIAPRTPPAGERGQIRNETSEPDDLSPEDDIELLPSLKGLVFVPAVKDVREAGRPGVKGVLVEGVELMDQADWSARLADRVGAPLTMGGLNGILREVVAHYRDSGRPVVDVVVTEQDITSGVVQLAVVEAALGEVRAEGAKHFKAERLAGQVRLRPGGPIESSILMADLAWLNQNPFRSVDLVYTPGVADGQTDVVLRIDDRFPMRVYGGWENSGNALTGDSRWFAGVNHGNLWGIDHQLNYQWTFNEDVSRLSAHSFSYVAPLPWRHTATVYGAYVESEAALPAPFQLSGETAQLSGRYTVPLPVPASGQGSLSHEFEFGWDFKHSTSNLEFGVLTALATGTDVQQLALGYRAGLKDALGATQFGAFAYLSPGDMGGGNDDAAFGLARAGAESEYAYGRLQAERVQRLPWDFSASLKGSVQFSDGNLLPSEQLGLGGYQSVRGYEEHEANVDRGYVLNAELRTPALSLQKAGEVQFLVFVDHGGGRSVDRLPGEGDVSMTSVGPGLRWTLGENVSLRFDYGFQLEDSGAGLGMGDSRAHIGAVLAW